MTEETTTKPRAPRMTTAEYEALFAKHDVTPDSGCYVRHSAHGECLACALGIRLIEHLGSVETAAKFIEQAWHQHQYMSEINISQQIRRVFDIDDHAFLAGVEDGWESWRDTPRSDILSGDTYIAGFEEGLAAKRAILLKDKPKIIP